METNRTTYRTARLATMLTTILSLAACVSPPPRGPANGTAAPAPPSVEVYFYPAKGQSKVQQERDRYECYTWARDQTGFDPSLPQLAPGQRIQIEPAPSGDAATAGAMTGAILGAVTSRRGEEREGAFKGAIAGAILGGLSEEAKMKEAERLAQQEQARQGARLTERAEDYRRAMAACLEGRGYKVK